MVTHKTCWKWVGENSSQFCFLFSKQIHPISFVHLLFLLGWQMLALLGKHDWKNHTKSPCYLSTIVMKTYRKNGNKAAHVLNLSTWQCMVSFTLSPFTPWEIFTSTQRMGDWVGVRPGLKVVVKRKIPVPTGN